MAQDTLKHDLMAAVASGRLVIVTGTGVTASATSNQQIDGHSVCSWVGLLRHGVWTLLETHGLIAAAKHDRLIANVASGELDEMVAVGEIISDSLKKKRPGDYHRWLKDSVGALNPTSPEIVRVLGQLGGLLTTLNYDGVLEQVLARISVTWRDRDRAEQLLRGELHNAVLHLHGYFDSPDSIVLGIREYEKVLNDPHLQTVLRSFLLQNTLLFVGCGGTVTDPNFSRLIDWAKPTLADSTHRHYILCREGELENYREDARDAPWLHPLAYGSRCVPSQSPF